jgi:cell wall-associated NlpC family hydrolase
MPRRGTTTVPHVGGRSAGSVPGGAPTRPPTPVEAAPAPEPRATGTLGSFAADLITSLGGSPTPTAKKLFQAWQVGEGGWSHNAARFNPLNLTAPGSGLPTMNSVGVVVMPSYQEGLRRTSELIRSGYPALATAFKTGQVNFQNPAVQADLNRWLSGNRTPGMTKYVRGIAGRFGQDLGAMPTTPAAPVSATPQTPQPPQPGVPRAPVQAAPQFRMGPPTFRPELYRQQIMQGFLEGGGKLDLMKMPGILQSSFQATLQASKPAPLKAVPTRQLQQRGVVDPGGDLQDPIEAKANPLLKAAGSQIGKPYVFGSGPSTGSFDCSDLIQWSYKQIGVDLPRTTFDQIKVGKAVDPSNPGNLRPGDLVFPSNHHVVMYVGNGKVIAAPHTGTVVQYQPLSQFGDLLAVRRVLPG